jgi:integrase
LLGEKTVGILRDRHTGAKALADEVGVELSGAGYVFSPDPAGKAPLMPSSLTQASRRLQARMAKESGEPWPYRLHDLRHCTATELFRAGHNPRTVVDRLGHADPALTLRVYTHDTEDQARAAASSLEVGLASV